MCENEHYEAAVRKNGSEYEVISKLNIGGIKHIEKAEKISGGSVSLKIRFSNWNYELTAECDGREINLGCGQAKYLSSEVSGGFTGVMLGLYAVNGKAEFTDFLCKYE